MSRAALVVIDVQESFRQRPIWAYASNPDMVAPGRPAGRPPPAQRGDLVVWVLHSEPGTGGSFDPALGHVRLIDGLVARRRASRRWSRPSHNAFTTTNLQQLLTDRGRPRASPSAASAPSSACETTARVGCDLGYEVTFVTDATATFPIPHRDAAGTAAP